ncbi:hypothetical protein D3C72_1386260 [compost metagenome]
MWFGGWPLAHHVDGSRRVAAAGDQAGGAADHFDAVEHRQVRLHTYAPPLVRTWQAVVHDVVDIETAGAVSLAPWPAGLAEEQAWGGLDYVVDAGHGLVVHALAGDHGHRLRGFAHGQRQFCRCFHLAGGVGTSALSGLAKPGGVDAQGIQDHRLPSVGLHLSGFIGRGRFLCNDEGRNDCQRNSNSEGTGPKRVHAELSLHLQVRRG